MEALPLQPDAETLLMIDDEPLMTELFRQYMTRRGFRVLTAQSGPEGLELLRNEHGAVRLVISDMELPQMDGIDIACAIEEIDPSLPVLIATGHDKTATQAGIPANVIGVVQKPYHNKVLADHIRVILDARQPADQTPPSAS